jgi:uncharacterized protein YukE
MTSAPPPGNPLIALAEEPDALEGAGILSDLQDLGKVNASAFTGDGFDVSRIDPVQEATAVTGAGLSALGVVGDPLQALAEVGLGWLIEHVSFLREPLDQLAGKPSEIKAHAHTWHNIGTELARIAGEHEARLGQVQCWQGAAADTYRAAARRRQGALLDTASSAEKLAKKIMSNGTAVASVRSVVRDMIVDFVVKIAEWLIPALASAAATAGAALVPFIAGAVAQALEVASRIVQVVSKLVKYLEQAGAELGRLAASAERAAERAAEGASAGAAAGRFGSAQLNPANGAKVMLEPYKQAGTSERDQEKWIPL